MDVDPPTEPPGRTLARGVCRLLEAEGWAVLTELTLANGRRVDVAAVDKKARFLVVEVKSSVADFTSDHKWQDYLGFADLFAFAVPEEFPQERIPESSGLIVADRYGADWLRSCPSNDPTGEAGLVPLSAARRKALLIRFAEAAARRLRAWEDPDRE